jgi:hypothetical protein
LKTSHQDLMDDLNKRERRDRGGENPLQTATGELW